MFSSTTLTIADKLVFSIIPLLTLFFIFYFSLKDFLDKKKVNK